MKGGLGSERGRGGGDRQWAQRDRKANKLDICPPETDPGSGL